jgi:hypothetical protein
MRRQAHRRKFSLHKWNMANTICDEYVIVVAIFIIVIIIIISSSTLLFFPSRCQVATSI